MVKSIIKRILIGVGIIFVLNLFRTGSLFGFINTYALDRIELADSSGNVLWYGGLTSNYPVVNNVKFINFKFNLDTASQSKYTLDWQFSYTSRGNGSPGLHLDWFLLGSNSYQNPNNSWTTLNQQSGPAGAYLEYINHIPFTSSYNGTQQVSLSYSFETPRTITQVSYENKRLNYNGSTSSETNATINNGVNNIINNNNTNTNNIINNQNNNTNKIIDSQNQTNNTIKDDTPPEDSDVKGIFDFDSNTSNTPISDLISMPITLLQAYLDGFSASCTTFNLGTLFGHNLSIPCIQPQRYLGDNLWSLIDICISLFLSYNVGLMCISIFESITSLDDNFQTLYTPRHAQSEYKPKHGGSD